MLSHGRLGALASAVPLLSVTALLRLTSRLRGFTYASLNAARTMRLIRVAIELRGAGPGIIPLLPCARPCRRGRRDPASSVVRRRDSWPP